VNYICFIGENRVGKTTVSNALAELLSKGCQMKVAVMAWGDAVRTEIVELYGIPASIISDKSINKNTTMVAMGDWNYHESVPAMWVKYKIIKEPAEFAKLNITLRDLFIIHATRIRRADDQYYWVTKFNEVVQTQHRDADCIIIDDTRFDSEFEYLSKHTTSVYQLTNVNQTTSDLAQDSIINWIKRNKEKITDTIDLPIPVTQSYAEEIAKTLVVFPIKLPVAV